MFAGVSLLQLINSTHPSQLTRLYEMPPIFDDNVTQSKIREQLPPERTIQQEIDVRIVLRGHVFKIGGVQSGVYRSCTVFVS